MFPKRPPPPPIVSTDNNTVTTKSNPDAAKANPDASSTKRLSPNDDHNDEDVFIYSSKKHTAPMSKNKPNNVNDSMDITIPSDVLGNDVMLNDPNIQQLRKAPPIYIEARFNWHSQVQNLRSIAASLQFASTKSAKFLRLSIDTDDEYRALVKHLIATKVPYKSQTLRKTSHSKLYLGVSRTT